jgi:uncharacterized protein (TIGR03435 family)
VSGFQIRGPAWLDSAAFAVDATMPPQTTREQFRAMLQNLFAERFRLSSHLETKELSGYRLVVAKGGPKMNQSAPAPPAPAPETAEPDGPPRRLPFAPDGFPLAPPRLPPGAGDNVPLIATQSGWRFYFQQRTTRDLAGELQKRLQRPVTDATALNSRYDFTLTYLPDFMPAPTDPRYPPAPDLFAALQSQLGLKLEPGKLPTRIVVIDRIERTPTAN